MDHTYENRVIFQDFDSILLANPELGEIVGDCYNKIMTEIYNVCKNSPHVKQRTANPLLMSRMAYFQVQGTSNLTAKLPGETDKRDYEEQLAQIIYWYLFGN